MTDLIDPDYTRTQQAMIKRLLTTLALISSATMAQRPSNPYPGDAFPAGQIALQANLPFEPIGVSDLVRLVVSDSPELSQSFRVDKAGNLNLPLLHMPIAAKGLLPDALGAEIAAALNAQHLLVHPTVVVSVMEYTSRGVSVVGAVRTPTTIQDFGGLRVLAALSAAGGVLPEAAPEIVVEQADGTSQRLSMRKLLDGLHPELNLPLTAGARISVPECDRVFVVGDVKRPGSFPFRSTDDTTVLQLLALSGGVDSYSRDRAYIYRAEPGLPQKKEIEVPLKRILDRKAPDMKLAAGDILYVPTNGMMKASASLVQMLSSQ